MCFSVLKMTTQFVTYFAAGFPNELNWNKIQKLGCVSSELTIRSLLPDSLEACKRLHILENLENIDDLLEHINGTKVYESVFIRQHQHEYNGDF